jgi:hypothetical protein
MPGVEDVISTLMNEADEELWKEAGLFDKTYITGQGNHSRGQYSPATLPFNASTSLLTDPPTPSPGNLKQTLSFRQTTGGYIEPKKKVFPNKEKYTTQFSPQEGRKPTF